jgi:hypothetical protein
MILSGLLPGAAAAQTASSGSPDGIWSDTPEKNLVLTAEGRWFVPQKYRSLTADPLALLPLLGKAPLENSPEALSSPLEISLPMPYGGYQRFNIYNSPVMEAELAAKFPEIQTFIAVGIDDPFATGRLDWTPFGFHAMILSPNGQFFIDPYQRGDVIHYMSYYKTDYQPVDKAFLFNEPIQPDDSNREILPDSTATVQASSGTQLRTYRLAVAATGEYSAHFGGTVPLGMAAIVVSINRVTGIYEREVAVRLVLVTNNDLIVYTNGTTDPYTNNDGLAMLGQNQSNLDSVIGNANYDVGHVFSTNGGGIAMLKVPCWNSYKAQGVTGTSNPHGDAYDVDYVAHEMGHQFGANHTFNGTVTNCSGSNRNASTAYEPGSASTIMGYAGICGTDNLQSNSDDYFHGISFDEIVAYTTNTSPGYGGSCPVTTSSGNHAPVVNAGIGGFTIPEQTPFTLTGSATDSDGDALTYNWEEWDLGAAGSPTAPTGTAPWFRSWPSTTSPERTFPRLSDLVNNTVAIGENLPNISSNLTRTFRLTARDNKVATSAGGVGNASISFTVTSSAGPFAVTAPNTAVSWTGNTSQNVTWNVASTNAAPVSCANVVISLSTDGGYTYPTTILASTPNDGSQEITVPNISTTQARVRVGCATSIFFDISNVNFTIVSGNTAPVAQNGTLTTAEDTPGNVTLVATDAESPTLTYAIQTSPVYGSLSGSAPNLTYTPTADYNGPDSFTFKAYDGSLYSNLATITITVTPVNDPPVASIIAGTEWFTRLLGAYTIPVFTDVDGDTLTYSALLSGGAALPAWLTFTVSTRTFSGTPLEANAGSYAIVVSADDGVGGNASASPFTLQVSLSRTVYLPMIQR